MASGVGFGSFGLRLFGAVMEADIVALQLAVEGGAANTEHFAGESFVAMCLLEDAQDCHALHFSERCGGKGRGVLCVHRLSDGLFRANGGRKILDVDGMLIAESDSASDAVFQFADIAGPIVLKKALHGRGRDLHRRARGVAI